MTTPKFLHLKRALPSMMAKLPRLVVKSQLTAEPLALRADVWSLMRAAMSATCFVVERPEELFAAGGHIPTAAESRLPLPCCLIELPMAGGPCVVVCRQEQDGAVSIFSFLWDNDGWILAPAIATVSGWGARFAWLQFAHFTEFTGSPAGATQYCKAIVPVVTNILQALVRSHVEDRIIAAGSVTRQRLQAKGAKGWDYHMVTVKPFEPPVVHVALGGTHASPRWHERRGHWRNLRSGKQAWIRHCEVGDKARGGVVHDYLVEVA